MPDVVNAAARVVVFQWPWGMAADDRAAGLTLLGGDVYVTGRTQDALPGLGLAAETLIAREPKAGASEETADGPERVGLDILDNLNLLTKADVERTASALDGALRRIRTGFRNLTAPETEPDPLAGVGPPPPHIAAQIANYQAALARLSGPAPILF